MADNEVLSLEELLGNLSNLLQLVLILGTLEEKVKKLKKLSKKVARATSEGDLVKATKKYNKLLLTLNELLASLNLASLEELLNLLEDDEDD